MIPNPQEFDEMWTQLFVWNLSSSIICHSGASACLHICQKKWRIGRFLPAIVLVFGLLTPITWGVVTNAFIAYVYITAGFYMTSLSGFGWGIAQTLTVALGFAFVVVNDFREMIRFRQFTLLLPRTLPRFTSWG